jgi:purine-binding chemotaxis protein CheW
VPNTPQYVIGVTSLRGAVLPVIDPCLRLGLAPGARDERSRIIVTDLNDEGTGIIVDRVTGVVRFSAEEVRPAPESVERGAEFLSGIVRKNDRLYILLDVDSAAGL